jgi:non-heme chloroperoxidase
MKHLVKTIGLAGRTALCYVEQGEPTGMPVILLHGITDSWRSFEIVLPHLPPSLHVFALTQRGHGGGDTTAHSYRTRDFAADVAAFMQVQGIGRALIVGHSMGATNAMRLAIDHPQRTLALVLAGSFASFSDKPDLIAFVNSEVARLADPIHPEFARDWQQSTLAQKVPAQFFATMVSECMRMPARVWRAAFNGLLEDDFVGELQHIDVPTLLLWGQRDAFCPRADQQLLLNSIAGSRLVTYPDAGHALHWEEPERFAADLVAFARSLAVKTTA